MPPSQDQLQFPHMKSLPTVCRVVFRPGGDGNRSLIPPVKTTATLVGVSIRNVPLGDSCPTSCLVAFAVAMVTQAGALDLNQGFKERIGTHVDRAGPGGCLLALD